MKEPLTKSNHLHFFFVLFSLEFYKFSSFEMRTKVELILGPPGGYRDEAWNDMLHQGATEMELRMIYLLLMTLLCIFNVSSRVMQFSKVIFVDFNLWSPFRSRFSVKDNGNKLVFRDKACVVSEFDVLVCQWRI